MFSHIKELFTRPSGYTISRSVRLRSSASAYLNRTPASAGSQTTWTLSFWVKRGLLSASGGGYLFSAYSGATNSNLNFYFDTSDQFRVVSDGTNYRVTTPLYRDPASWYHIVVTADTTNATAQSRLRIYVNGVEVTAWAANTTITQNQNLYWNGNWAHAIGRYANVGSYFDGYLTEINFIDGQALTPSSFGETDSITGVWKAKKYAGTYGTNGFYLNFSDNSNNTAATIGKDYSGNGNNWTPNNISVTAGATYDSMLDSPTVSAVSSNYCVLNPLDRNTASLSDGNLKLINGQSFSTFRVSSGKWYFEATVNQPSAVSDSNNYYVGTGDVNGVGTQYSFGGTRWNGSSWVSFGASYTNNDVIGVTIDCSTGTITYYKNNVSQGTQSGTASIDTYVDIKCSNASDGYYVNFGQRPFTYTPPSGYVALNTWNLPDSTIKNGAQYMSAVLYTGDGNTNRSITGVGFQTDFNWTKSRSSASYSHQLADSVRGWSKYLYSNATNAEGTDATNHIQSVNSDGYVINSGASFNASGVTYVAWDWKAGGSSSSNTNGSITSTVSVGATQGFSVATYTGNGSAGATFGHGLGVAPSFVIVKERGNANGWLCYHVSTGNTGYLELDATLSFQTLSTVWNNTTPSSTVVTLGTVSNVNRNGGTFVAYCFAAVKGFSAFGSYTGNGSTDGPFVYLGFRPRWIMQKVSSGTANWWAILDTSRDTYNVLGEVLQAQASNAGQNYTQLDILSNGFKIRTTGISINESGSTFIYAAFAENPFKNALAR